MSGNSRNTEKPARVGRPRASQVNPDGPVREEILSAARALFREKGFKGTSTREIADRAGLRQPSLFHYFKNKGEIFRAVALGTVQPVLDFVQQENELNHKPDVAFYRLVRFDTYHLCTNENVLGSPFQFLELTRESQPEFWQLRDDIVGHYQALLKKGEHAKVFDVPDIAIVTNLLFSLGESTLTWYRWRMSDFDPAQVADVTATIALRAVLADLSRLDDVVDQATQGLV